MKRKMTAYPLFVKDPFFSFWLSGDYLNESSINHWAGQKKSFLGLIRYNGKTYRFMGDDKRFEGIKQIDLEVGLFDSRFMFENDDLKLNVKFLSPLPLDNLELLSNPCCFLEYEIIPKKEVGDVLVSLYINENVSYQNKDFVRGDVINTNNLEIAYFGLEKQEILSHTSDLHYPDWGYYYILGQSCEFDNEDIFNNDYYISASNKHNGNYKGKFIFAYDEVCAIYYYGELLRSLYFDDLSKNMFTCMIEANQAYDDILDICNKFEEKVFNDCKPFGDDYKNIIISSYRQSVASHKAVKDKKGRVLFLSKEDGSDGCIATVDISYPTMPIFLCYNPKLIESILYPIVDFARMPVWEFDFAPHDAGVYPYCLGQFYAIYNKGDSKYQKSICYRKLDYGVLPRYFQYPKGLDIYNFAKQMPVEECGNMIILSYLAAKETNDLTFIKENIDLLEKWANYLVSKDVFPEHQLCTDDFAGPSKYNINLGIKSTVAIAVFDKILEILGKSFGTYYKEALKRVDLLMEQLNNDILPLGKDLENTFSLKYNLFADVACETDLFPKLLIENEFNEYINKSLEFGCPLDSRANYSKTDWQIWVSSIVDDVSKQQEIYKRINKFICESIDRYPFADWYDCEKGKPIVYSEDGRMFINRPVQAGCFAPIYIKKIKDGKGE